jgi:hypothetical protein
MTYYDEDNPEIDDIVEKVFGEQVEDHRSHEQKRNDEAVARHEEMMEMLGGIFVQLSRIYDVLMLGLPGPVVQRDEVDQVHTNGDVYGSPPTLSKDAWS